MASHSSGLDVQRHAAIQRTIIGEPPLDVFTLVSKRYREFIMPIVMVMHHNVPQNRHAADFDHWLWTNVRLFSQTGSGPACKNRNLHGITFGLSLAAGARLAYARLWSTYNNPRRKRRNLRTFEIGRDCWRAISTETADGYRFKISSFRGEARVWARGARRNAFAFSLKCV